ncbi:MAG: AI-2E family transporter [Candidatus Magasanikbacteria bacterium]|nr:AI-2E family transporter [Candidatus Magasanikbacteria bacterium]
MDFIKMRHFLFFILLAGVTYLFFTILQPFFYPLFWAAILASIFYPTYKKIKAKTKSPNFSSALTLVLIFFIIVLPLVLISTLVIKETLDLYDAASNNSHQIATDLQNFFSAVQSNSIIQKLHINQTLITSKLTELAQSFTGFILLSAKIITQNSLIFAGMFVVMFYALFFFVRDGEKLLKELMHLCPLGDRYEKILYDKFTSTVRATIKGTLILGLIQGVMGFGMFFLAGIKGAAVWGVLMVILACIPALGCYFVWLPAAIGELIIGNTGTGIAMILFGTVVIGTIDNLLRPVLVGRDSQLHPLLVLFSTLGGLATFGISGFVIGPVIASLLLAFWEMYDQYYKKDLDNNSTVV